MEYGNKKRETSTHGMNNAPASPTKRLDMNTPYTDNLFGVNANDLIPCEGGCQLRAIDPLHTCLSLTDFLTWDEDIGTTIPGSSSDSLDSVPHPLTTLPDQWFIDAFAASSSRAQDTTLWWPGAIDMLPPIPLQMICSQASPEHLDSPASEENTPSSSCVEPELEPPAPSSYATENIFINDIEPPVPNKSFDMLIKSISEERLADYTPGALRDKKERKEMKKHIAALSNDQSDTDSDSDDDDDDNDDDNPLIPVHALRTVLNLSAHANTTYTLDANSDSFTSFPTGYFTHTLVPGTTCYATLSEFLANAPAADAPPDKYTRNMQARHPTRKTPTGTSLPRVYDATTGFGHAIDSGHFIVGPNPDTLSESSVYANRDFEPGECLSECLGVYVTTKNILDLPDGTHVLYVHKDAMIEVSFNTLTSGACISRLTVPTLHDKCLGYTPNVKLLAKEFEIPREPTRYDHKGAEINDSMLKNRYFIVATKSIARGDRIVMQLSFVHNHVGDIYAIKEAARKKELENQTKSTKTSRISFPPRIYSS
jgi:hypothetical protein